MVYNIFSLENAVNAGRLAIAGSFCSSQAEAVHPDASIGAC